MEALNASIVGQTTVRIRKRCDHIGRVFVLGAMLSCATTQPASPPQAPGPVSSVYPAEMRARGIESDVILMLTVLEDGSTSDIVVVQSGGAEFDRAAQEAMRAARFKPAMRDGIAVPVRIRWTYRFRIENDR